MIRIGLLSDTHDYLDPAIYKHFKECDEIWHAGDIGSAKVLDELDGFKPTIAVYGNIDGTEIRQQCKRNEHVTRENMRIWITHIGGRPGYYNRHLYAELKQNTPEIFVCGHSHITRVIYDKNFKMLYLNPGAAGFNGFHKVRTLLRFTIDKDKLKDMDVIELGKRSLRE